MKIKYEIVYNEYQSKYIVYATNEVNFNVKGIYSANTRKECYEWLKQYRKEIKQIIEYEW